MDARNRRPGFTIIELVVVIVLIAILVTVTIVTFTGISKRAHITAVKSDLASAAKSLMMASAVDGNYPVDLASAGLKSSGDTIYQYTYTSADNSYCLTAVSNDIAYMISTSDSSATAGVCPGHTGPSVPDGSSSGVTTLAGSGVAGFADGSGVNAQFNGPMSVAVDSAGNVYVADYNSQRIRKITSAGVVTTLAGSGVAGFADGTGASAKFNHPYGVAVDLTGAVYVADQDNSRIRKITPAGVVSTLAGGVEGFADGTGASAKFNMPAGVAVDSAGTVYVTDFTNQRIRKISPAGIVTTLAGSGVIGSANGTGTSAQFNYPVGIAVDTAGMVYVADFYGQRIRKITPAGVVSTLAGGVEGFADGAGASAKFSGPFGVAVDSGGTVYVADEYNQRIRKITPAGVVSTLTGSVVAGYADGTFANAQFNYPAGAAVDSAGNVYVADYSNYRIRKIQP